MLPEATRISPEQKGRDLLSVLAEMGYPLSADSGGKGTCGKCRVKLVDGLFYDKHHPKLPLTPDENGYVLACQALCSEVGATLLLSDTKGTGLTHFKSAKKDNTQMSAHDDYGLALDIGTTTLAMALVNTKTGEVTKTISELNPQRRFGADVMSRIGATKEGHLEALHEELLGTVRHMAQTLLANAPIDEVSRMIVVGNTTMLHLFYGISPAGMSAYPFTPAFLGQMERPGKFLGLPASVVTSLASASAFVGSDISAGVMLCEMTKSPTPTLLIDIGTNGEMVLFSGTEHGGKLYATSTAAGPALEGAGISCGMGGLEGAICQVSVSEDGLMYDTISHLSPVGICGSGLIDLIAVLLDKGEIDDTGYMENSPFVLCQNKEGEDIYLSAEDVRAFQLAKGAIRAGMEVLVAESGFNMADITTLYIAGGLGFYMNGASAIRTGMLPQDTLPIITSMGNSALGGAIASLVDETKAAIVADIASRCQIIELNKLPAFSEAFMEHMLFPEQD